ncbi:hypothetical protein ACE1B6_24925 [Aerosakkonemataceae cyanobacterium BLCC-F154]|uniref:Uncharacterized protein n=1 Tax=Floridaenema fluviatile BLCC-F154 TaxID=3153640 RepID=A0ABV4YKZ2_9CYAN
MDAIAFLKGDRNLGDRISQTSKNAINKEKNPGGYCPPLNKFSITALPLYPTN